MASPFSVFRKRQKLMMALLCVAFVFLPVLSDLIGGREKGPAVHAAVETAKYGKLYEWDLERMRRQRQQVLAVLDDLATQAEISPYLTQYRLQSMFGPANDVSVVNSWLLARRAEELGMVISDDTINAFLREWTNRAVPRAEILKTFQKAGLKTEQFFAMLREELLAKQLWETFQSSLGAATPAQRWDYFNRVHCSATLEAIPIAVASFVQQIDDPPEAELKEFFEKSKHRIPNPESPDPGFRKPHRVELHYLKAEIEKFSAPTMITDAEIEEYYQKNKEAYDKAYKPSPKETDSYSKDADAKTHAADVQQEKKSAED